VSTLSIGVKIKVESYYVDSGNIILVPDNEKELVSSTSQIEQV
jgi:hypothetical protein